MTSKLTLRDLFAGLAMQASVAGPGAEYVTNGKFGEMNWHEYIASEAYAMADAMLIARDQRP